MAPQRQQPPPDRALAARAVSHPLRSWILDRLQGRELAAHHLADELDDDALAVNHVAYHVGVLRDAGMIREVRSNQIRGAVEHIYTAVWSVTIQVEPARGSLETSSRSLGKVEHGLQAHDPTNPKSASAAPLQP